MGMGKTIGSAATLSSRPPADADSASSCTEVLDERVLQLKEFFTKLGGRFECKKKKCDRVVGSNRQDKRLQWRVGMHYGQAGTRAEGRVKQGGAGKPYIVCKSALRAYYDTL